MAKRINFFWASYADLMTSLFFIMLVLFLLTIVILKRQQANLQADVDRLNKIIKLEQQFAPLQNDPDFYFLPECKKYIYKELMGVEIFNPNAVQIKSEFIDRTLKAGRKIQAFIMNLNMLNPGFTYLLVIEGNMANKFDYSIEKDNKWGYIQSYQRALSVYNLWTDSKIDFRQYNVEVVICGSGFNGLCRDAIEENNKRFSIQIIPKVSNN